MEKIRGEIRLFLNFPSDFPLLDAKYWEDNLNELLNSNSRKSQYVILSSYAAQHYIDNFLSNYKNIL